MRLLNAIAAAGLLISTGTIATAAQAQDHRGGYDQRHHGYHQNGRHDGGRRVGWNNAHRHCWTQLRHHRQVRVCR